METISMHKKTSHAFHFDLKLAAILCCCCPKLSERSYLVLCFFGPCSAFMVLSVHRHCSILSSWRAPLMDGRFVWLISLISSTGMCHILSSKIALHYTIHICFILYASVAKECERPLLANQWGLLCSRTCYV